MSSTKINALVNVLNGVFSQMKLSDSFLSKLPDNSWSLTVNLDNNIINVESFKNDSMLMETGNFVAASEIYWYGKVIPVVAVVLFNNVSSLSTNDVVRFNFKNEEKDSIFVCNAHELAAHVYPINMGDFGTMMSLMEPE